MPLRPDKTTHKILLSTTSHFDGEYEHDGIFITHAWPNLQDRNLNARWIEGPASRNAYVLAFKTEETTDKLVIPDYSYVGDLICVYLSVLFGKKFDCHGLIEGSGFFKIPDYSLFTHLCEHRLPQNSRAARVDYPFPLNLTELHRLDNLIMGGSIPDNFTPTFNAAGKCYSRALQNAENDPEISYLLLITAGEILASFYKQKEQNIHAWNLLDDEMANYLSTIRTTLANGEEMAATISNKILKVKSGFVKTIVNLIESDFFEKTESQSDRPALNNDIFEKSISASYDLRSLYVHSGISFGKWVALRMGSENNELLPGKPIIGDKTLERTLGKALTYVGLERTIRYCLLKFAEQNGALSIAQASPLDTTSS